MSEADAPSETPGAPALHLAGFDGPMDVLLDLAERQRIDLGRISILQLAEQFVAGLARLERQVSLERRADWLVMATGLILLRSRLLFPASPEDEAEAAQEADREARRLDQMMTARAAAAWLERRPQLGRDVLARPHGRNARVASYMALMEACLFVLRGREGRPGTEDMVYRLAPAAFFRVDEAMTRIRTLVVGQGRIDFIQCLPAVKAADPLREMKARSAVASSFAAVLELARSEEVMAHQTEQHDPILLYRAHRR